MPKIAVFGANGFVGQAVCKAAVAAGHEIIAFVRRPAPMPCPAHVMHSFDVESIVSHLQGCDWAVNCAGRAHVVRENDPDAALANFRAVNRDLAMQLARHAASAGVSRFVQISSVAAVRSTCGPGEVLSDASEPAPDRPYGVSKLEADHALAALSTSSMGIVSLRPPALIGIHPAGLVRMFANAASKGIPLPLGKINNRRSFVAVDNLASAVLAALSSDLEGSFMVTDSDPVSVGRLYSNLLKHGGHPDRCFNIPASFLNKLAALVLRQRRESLLGDAAYDGSAFAHATGWVPPVSMDDAQASMMSAYNSGFA